MLSLGSLLNDIASDMVMPLLPMFLAGLAGGSATTLGLIEGMADLVSSALKWWSGRLADRAGRTWPFVVTGYALAALARPFLCIAALPAHVLAVRLVDRVGKGLRSAPRDALLAASVPAEQRGAAFGFHRSMDHAGATLGPLLALALLTWWTTDLRMIFAVAIVPGLLAVLMVTAAREVPRTTSPASPEAASEVSGPVPPSAWRVLLPIGLATLGTASDTFLMLKAGVDEHAPLTALPLLWVALHLVRTFSATPGGWLSDRLGARGILSVGWSVRALVFLRLALAPDLGWTLAAVVLYGLAGVSEGAEKQLVAQSATAQARGAAFGTFHAVVGVASLPASLGFGWLWDSFGVDMAFSTAAVLVAMATALLWALGPRK